MADATRVPEAVNEIVPDPVIEELDCVPVTVGERLIVAEEEGDCVVLIDGVEVALDVWLDESVTDAVPNGVRLVEVVEDSVTESEAVAVREGVPLGDGEAVVDVVVEIVSV